MMGSNDRQENDSYYHSEKCPQCGNVFYYREETQCIGCRFLDELRCPFCGNLRQRSGEVEFYTKKEMP